MSNKFIDSIKHAIIEDDDPKTEQKPQSQASHSVASEASSGNTAPHMTVNTQPVSEEVEHVYQRILAKTNFDSTQIAATIHKYLDPLVAIPSLDERTRFKTAVIQAKAQEGLTKEKILATFDGLKVALQNEQESFTASAQATKEREIADRQRGNRCDRPETERDFATPTAPYADDQRTACSEDQNRPRRIAIRRRGAAPRT